MKPSEALDAHRAAIRRVVESHRDLDILIDPTPETTLMDIGAIRHELGQLLGMSVDVLAPDALPDSFRASVIAQARPI